jgi:ribonuclease HI
VTNLLTPAVWNTQLRLMFNALPFDRRRAKANRAEERPSPLTASLFPCYFCGRGEDSVEHVYGECQVVRAARGRLAEMVGVQLADGLDVTMIAFPRLESPAAALGIVCFNWSVWAERTEYHKAMGYVPDPGRAANRIFHRSQLKIPADKQKLNGQEKAVADFAWDPPKTATIGFTDGCSKPNPGPCGSGYTLRGIGEEQPITVSKSWGQGDNNRGEMGALHDILTEILARIKSGTIPLKTWLFLFTDSMLCVGYLLRGWAFPVWTKLARDTKKLLREVRRQLQMTLYWIRGHDGIPGNEDADVAAKKGADQAVEEAAKVDSAPPP